MSLLPGVGAAQVLLVLLQTCTVLLVLHPQG